MMHIRKYTTGSRSVCLSLSTHSGLFRLPSILVVLGTILMGLMILTLASCKSCNQNAKDEKDLSGMMGDDSTKPLRTVRLLPYWVPSAQFAGYYTGIEKKIYQKHGIRLTILPFDPVLSPGDAISQKKTDFAILWMVNAIEIKGKAVDIVNIAQFSSRSSLMLISRKSSGISKLEDMNGKRAGIWLGYDMQPKALFKKYNLNVNIVNIGSTNNLFLQGGVDILNANWYDEYHAILNSGVNEDELNKFFFADYGLNFLEDGIYCLKEMTETDPDLCRDFVAASVESWKYAFDHQEEAIAIVDKYARMQNQPVNNAHQQWMLSHYKTMYIPDGKQEINTGLKQSDFDNIQQIMLENHFIPSLIPFNDFYRPFDKLTDRQEKGAK